MSCLRKGEFAGFAAWSRGRTWSGGAASGHGRDRAACPILPDVYTPGYDLSPRSGLGRRSPAAVGFLDDLLEVWVVLVFACKCKDGGNSRFRGRRCGWVRRPEGGRPVLPAQRPGNSFFPVHSDSRRRMPSCWTFARGADRRTDRYNAANATKYRAPLISTTTPLRRPDMSFATTLSS